MLETYPDSVKIVFKNFPLSFHAQAKSAAIAAMAAARQGKFWEYHDLLFKYLAELNPAKMESIAQQIGLDLQRFRQDVASPAALSKVEQDMQDGIAAGVNGTPTLFINGRLVGKRDLEVMKKMVADELVKKETGEKRLR